MGKVWASTADRPRTWVPLGCLVFVQSTEIVVFKAIFSFDDSPADMIFMSGARDGHRTGGVDKSDLASFDFHAGGFGVREDVKLFDSNYDGLDTFVRQA